MGRKKGKSKEAGGPKKWLLKFGLFFSLFAFSWLATIPIQDTFDIDTDFWRALFLGAFSMILWDIVFYEK